MDKISISGMTKAILIVVVLGLIVGFATYMKTNNNVPGMDLINAALNNPKAYAYGVNECAKPVIPGTSMTASEMEYYLAYHLTATTFTTGPPNYTSTWYTCPVFNIVYNTMKAQPESWFWDTVIPTMEETGECDVPDQSDAPTTYCDIPNPA